MPRVPTYDIGGVANAPVPGVRFSANATGASFGGTRAKQLSQFGQALQATSDDIARSAVVYNETTLKRRDTSVARDSYIKASSEANQYMIDVFGREGKDAVDMYPEVEERLGEITRRYEESLSNPRQREFFRASFDRSVENSLNRTAVYIQEARKKFEADTIDAENSLAVDTAVAVRTDPSAIVESERTIRANTAYRYRGQGPDVQKQKTDEAVNHLHTSVLKALQYDSPEAAQGYLTANWDKFNPTLREELKKVLKDTVESKVRRDTAQQIVASGKSLEDQLKAVDKIKDPQRADAVRKRVKDLNEEKAAADKARSVQRYEGLVDQVFQDPDTFEVPLDLDAATQEKLYDLQKKLRKDKLAELGGTTPDNTDWGVYYELKSLPVEEFRDVDLLQYQKDLNETELKELIKEQRDARTDPAKVFALRTPYQTAKDVVQGLPDFDVRQDGRRGERAALRRQRFFTQYEMRLSQLPADQRTAAKQLEIANELLSPAPIPVPFWPDKKAYRFELPYIKERDRDNALRQNLPESLSAYPQVDFDESTQRYFVDGDGVRDVYDIYGNYLTSFRRVN